MDAEAALRAETATQIVVRVEGGSVVLEADCTVQVGSGRPRALA